MDHIHNEASARGMNPGKVVILPSSFAGSPRAMQQNFQDAMAIVTNKGKPDLFLTFTCNPRSKEITENLLDGHQPSDRPDLIACVFKMQLDELQCDISNKGILGRIVAKIHVIEFQKRGLPHANILLWLCNEDKLRTADDVDKLICAELPYPAAQPHLYEIIKSRMVHCPCGIINGKSYEKSVCMKEGSCSKGYPKNFNDSTVICDDGYPRYQRRNDGRSINVRGANLDNWWIVPYNPALSLRYGSHINLEACMSVKSVKYIFKYVYKGHDCIMLELVEKNTYGWI